MAHAAAQHEQVPDGVVEGEPFPDVEDNTQSVKQAASHQPGYTSRRDSLKERLDGDDDEPPHPYVYKARQDPGSPDPENGHEHTESREPPDKTKQGPPPSTPQVDQSKRCIGTGDKQIDGGMIEISENPFDTRALESVVEDGREVHHDES